MDSFPLIFGNIANIITVAAGIIAFGGVLLAVRTAPRLRVETDVRDARPPQLAVTITSVGTNPVRDLELSVGSLDNSRHADRGDGAGTWAALERNRYVRVTTLAPGDRAPEPDEWEYQWRLGPEEGFFLTVRSRSGALPWLRPSATYVWPPVLRHASAPPARLVLLAERQFLTRIGSRRNAPKVDRQTRSQVAKRWLRGKPLMSATRATDTDFDKAITGSRRYVVVAFGASSQGGFWNALLRTMDAFSAKHAPGIHTIAVDLDTNPKLAQRYQADNPVHFAVFRAGAIVDQTVGKTTVPELEEAFKRHLPRRRGVRSLLTRHQAGK